MEKKNILYVSQEITPYLPENEISSIARYLPQGVQEKGRNIRTFMPRYGSVNERRNQLHEVIRLSGMNLVIDDTDHPLIIKVASIQAARMQVYFIDNEDYFQRKAVLKDKDGKDFEDNDERALFYARGVLETVIKLRWTPDVIHCHGWFSSFVPLLIKKHYQKDPLFKNSKVICSIYDTDFKGTLNKSIKEKVLMEDILPEDVQLLDEPNFENLSKLAIQYSDAVIQGSEEINSEVAKYIKDSKKPFLGYQGSDDAEKYIEAYDEFYQKIW